MDVTNEGLYMYCTKEDSIHRLFPSDICDLLNYWRPFYSGQDNLRTEVRWISTPPDDEWRVRYKLMGRDGTIFMRSYFQRSAYCIAYTKKRRAQCEFGDLIPERPLEAGEKSSSEKEADVDGCIVVDGGDDDMRCKANSLKKTRSKDAITQAGDGNTAELP